MNLEADIANWDQKSRSDILAIYDRYGDTENMLSLLPDFIAQPSLQIGATWLLKRKLEDYPQMLDLGLADTIFKNVDKIKHWETTLHILQIMQHLPISPEYRKAVEHFVRECLVSDILFVRAWAYSGFYHLAVQFPQYQSEASQLFDYALENEAAASVKARVRQLKKLGF